MAGELPQVALLPAGDEAGAQKPVAQQVRDPLSILNVGLSSWHRFHVGGVGHDQLEVTLQQIVDRRPIVARGFHGRMGNPLLLKTFEHLHHMARSSAKVLDLAHRLPARLSFQHAGHHRALLHVEARTTIMFDFHVWVFFRVCLPACQRPSPSRCSDSRVCTPRSSRRFSHRAVHERRPHQSFSSGLPHQSAFPGVRPTRGEPIHPTTIFISRGAPFYGAWGSLRK